MVRCWWWTARWNQRQTSGVKRHQVNLCICEVVVVTMSSLIPYDRKLESCVLLSDVLHNILG